MTNYDVLKNKGSRVRVMGYRPFLFGTITGWNWVGSGNPHWRGKKPFYVTIQTDSGAKKEFRARYLVLVPEVKP